MITNNARPSYSCKKIVFRGFNDYLWGTFISTKKHEVFLILDF